jgi:hypothetical protein
VLDCQPRSRGSWLGLLMGESRYETPLGFTACPAFWTQGKTKADGLFRGDGWCGRHPRPLKGAEWKRGMIFRPSSRRRKRLGLGKGTSGELLRHVAFQNGQRDVHVGPNTACGGNARERAWRQGSAVFWIAPAEARRRHHLFCSFGPVQAMQTERADRRPLKGAEWKRGMIF